MMAKRYIYAEAVEAMLNALEAQYREFGNDDAVRACICADIRLGAIPTADVMERKRGEWTYEPPDGANGFKGDYLCSCCKYPVGIQKQNYCPNCGAEMRKEVHSD